MTALAQAAELPDTKAVRGFFTTLEQARFSGIVDFDFGGRKRRFFCQDGKLISAQSGVAGENLFDLLVRLGRVAATDKATVFALAKDRKIPLEKALIESGMVAKVNVMDDVATLCQTLVGKCLTETGGRYQLTPQPGLADKLIGNPVPIDLVLSRFGDGKANEAAPAAARGPTKYQPLAKTGNPQIDEIREALNQVQSKDAYEVLELKSSASGEEIRKKYFELAKKWHTDRYAGVDLGDDKTHLEALFAAIAEAYNMISDDKKRQDYDAFIDRKRKGLPTDIKEIVEAEARFKRGDALLKKGEFEKALEDMQAAVKMNAGEAEFHAALGLALYSARGNSVAKEALAAVNKAIGMQPNLAVAYEYLARIYKAENDQAKARQYFEKCLSIDSKNLNAQRELRLMNMRSGKVQPTDPKNGLLGKLFKK